MRYLLDTDVLIDFLNDQKYANQLIPVLVNKGPLYMSVITVAELRAGFNQKQADFYLPKLYDMATVLDLDRKLAELGGEFRKKYNKSIADMLIAATATMSKCQLVTRNKKDFSMSEVKLYPMED